MRTRTPLDAVARHRRRVTTGVVLATVVLSSGSFVIFPLLPALQTSLGVTTTEIGFVAAAGFAAALIAELAVAPLADRAHGRIMGVAGALLMVASLVVAAFAVDAWWLIASRAIGGFGFGVFMAAASALLVRADPSRSGESLGRLSAAELAGISLGPLASGLLIAVASPAAILGWSALVVVIAVVPVVLTFREPPAPVAEVAGAASARPFDALTDVATASVPPVHGAAAVPRPPAISLDLLRAPRVVAIVLLYAAVMIPTGAYDGIWPRFMTDIGASEWLTALSYTLFAVPYVLLAGWAGRLADRRGGVSAFARGMLVLVPIVALYGVISNPWLATGVGFVESSGQALAFIGAAAAMAQTVPAARAGASQGLMRAVGLLAATVAAAASGWAYELGGALLLFLGTAALVVVVAGIGLLIVRRSRPRVTPDPLVHDDGGRGTGVDGSGRPVLGDLDVQVGGGERLR